MQFRAARIAGSFFAVVLAAGLSLGGAEASATYKLLYTFQGGTDGQNPQGQFVNINGTFYGTTQYGGANGSGTVFTITPAGVEKVLYSFKGGSDGSQPAAGLINVNGTLYGTTIYGGNGLGTVFSITPAGAENVVYAFLNNGADGYVPTSPVIYVNGLLYGTTFEGGAHSTGTVFSVTLAGVENVIHSFGGGSDGSLPNSLYTAGSAVRVHGDSGERSDVKIYGTTQSGGAHGSGTVFAITQAGVEKVIYSFSGGADGSTPRAGLVYANGAFVGTTSVGGGSGCSNLGCGSVFSIQPGASESVLYSFAPSGANGSYPMANLVVLPSGLYGTSKLGGANGEGTVFSVTPSGAEKVLYSFKGGTDGFYPEGGLSGVPGTLYGVTYFGGTTGCGGYGCGTVYSITP